MQIFDLFQLKIDPKPSIHSKGKSLNGFCLIHLHRQNDFVHGKKVITFITHWSNFSRYINLILKEFWDMGYITIYVDYFLWKYHQNQTRDIWIINFFLFFYLIKVYKNQFLTHFRYSAVIALYRACIAW